MAGKTVQRRLAAILAADVVGYSQLMSIDEVRTLDALKAHRRELLDPAIAAHHGRIVKTTGDGALPRTGASSSAWASMWGTSLSTGTISSGTASISQPAWRPSASPAAYASRARRMIKSGTSCGREPPFRVSRARARGPPIGQRFRSGGAGAELWGLFGARRSKPLAEGWGCGVCALWHFTLGDRALDRWAVRAPNGARPMLVAGAGRQ